MRIRARISYGLMNAGNPRCRATHRKNVVSPNVYIPTLSYTTHLRRYCLPADQQLVANDDTLTVTTRRRGTSAVCDESTGWTKESLQLLF